MRGYAFDVDETLEISGGPVKFVDLVALREQRMVSWRFINEDARGER